MSPAGSFRYEVEKEGNDEDQNKVTTIKCSGRLVAGNSSEFSDAVKQIIPNGGRIVIDLSDVSYLDSSGLGTLVGLKVSAIRQGYCILELSGMTPRVLELLRITDLTRLFSS